MRRPSALHVRRTLIGVALVAPPAAGSAQVLTFEGIGPFDFGTAPVGNFYDGGGGPDLGVTFAGGATALCLNLPDRLCSSASRGGRGDPASAGTGLVFLGAPRAFITRAAGFTTRVSFVYTAPFEATRLFVYDGPDGTGSVLASLALPTTPGGPGPCYAANFCPFVPAGVAFDGVARSVVVTGPFLATGVVLDDVTFGGRVVIPEPSTYALTGAGLTGLGLAARRRRHLSR